MRSEQIKGAVDKLAGRAQGAVGELMDDPQMQAAGATRQVVGQMQQSYGEALDHATDFVREKPLATLAIMAGLGILAGLLLRRR